MFHIGANDDAFVAAAAAATDVMLMLMQ